jgi:hypothetical protein
MAIFRATAAISGLSAILFAACNAPPADEVEAPDLSLLFGATASSVDSLTGEMIRRQRQLFDILLSEDRSRLADYLELEFGWGPPPSMSITPGGAIARRTGSSAPSGYFAFLAGFTPPLLTAMPEDYRVRPESNGHLMVLAGPVADGAYLATYWRQADEGWRAIRMVGVPSEYAQRMLRQQR